MAHRTRKGASSECDLNFKDFFKIVRLTLFPLLIFRVNVVSWEDCLPTVTWLKLGARDQ